MRQGYTLAELLVAVTLGSVVLASLGGIMLISEVKVSANLQNNLDTKDAANRMIDLMRREAVFSRYFYNTNSTTVKGIKTLTSCEYLAPVAYSQSNDASICYKSVDPLDPDFPAEYKAAGSVFKGPCVLARLGPPYNPDGTLDTTKPAILQVLLDGLAKKRTASDRSPCSANRGFTVTMLGATSTTTKFSRNADMTIKLDSGQIYNFSVQAPSNPRYDGNDFWNITCKGSGSASGCGSLAEASYHFKPEGMTTGTNPDCTADFCGNNGKENIFYFDYPRSAYTLSSCTYNLCTIKNNITNNPAINLNRVDALIFTDQEIRPQSK